MPGRPPRFNLWREDVVNWEGKFRTPLQSFTATPRPLDGWPCTAAGTSTTVTARPTGRSSGSAVSCSYPRTRRMRSGSSVRTSTPRLFESFFDVLEPSSLHGKPVLIGATVGTARHSLVIEHTVRPMLAYLRAAAVPTGVCAASEDRGTDDPVPLEQLPAQ